MSESARGLKLDYFFFLPFDARQKIKFRLARALTAYLRAWHYAKSRRRNFKLKKNNNNNTPRAWPGNSELYNNKNNHDPKITREKPYDFNAVIKNVYARNVIMVRCIRVLREGLAVECFRRID